VLAGVISWGFKSPSPHHTLEGTYGPLSDGRPVVFGAYCSGNCSVNCGEWKLSFDADLRSSNIEGPCLLSIEVILRCEGAGSCLRSGNVVDFTAIAGDVVRY
jgi:hypothetical protein